MATPPNSSVPAAAGLLLAWLLEALRPMNRTRVKQLLAAGRVRVNGAVDHALQPAAHRRPRRGHAPPAGADRTLERAGLAVLFEDDAVLAVDKPSGLLTVATDTEKADTAFARLAGHLAATAGGPAVRRPPPRPGHVGAAAVRPQHRRPRRVQAGWAGATKTYLAVVRGVPAAGRGGRRGLPDGNDQLACAAASRTAGGGAKWAVTRYRVARVAAAVQLTRGRAGDGPQAPNPGAPRRARLPGRSATPPTGRRPRRPAGSDCTPGGWRSTTRSRAARVELESPLPAALRRVLG